MKAVPIISLSIGIIFLLFSYVRRKEFRKNPYWHIFIYFHLFAIGLHQFEEYGFPGEFRDHFVIILKQYSDYQSLLPSTFELELLNAFGFTVLFGLLGYIGTRIKWIGMVAIYINFGNGFFHLIYSIIYFKYLPGTITGTILYLLLGIYATIFIVEKKDITMKMLIISFYLGILGSFAPFLHIHFLKAIE